MMELWEAMLSGNVSTGRLWLKLDPELRKTAATALYSFEWGDEPVRQEAEAQIAKALNFRLKGVRKLPVEQRITFLARSVRPDDSLLTSLLQALHIEHRREVMMAFLDVLEIPHEEGLIDVDQDSDPPDLPLLEKAIDSILESHAEDAPLYLLTLYLMDSDTWGGVAEVMAKKLAV